MPGCWVDTAMHPPFEACAAHDSLPDSKQCAWQVIPLLIWPACQRLQLVARLAAVQCVPGSTTY